MLYYYHDITNWIISSEFLPCTGLHRSITLNQVATRFRNFPPISALVYYACTSTTMHSGTGVLYITLFTADQASLSLQY